MANENYVAPELGLEAFNCSFCGAYSHQRWDEIEDRPMSLQGSEGIYTSELYDDRVEFLKGESDSFHVCSLSKCMHCGKIAIWIGAIRVYPDNISVELPNTNMPEDIKKIYNEASSIVNISAKSAAALLRLALEKLLIHLGAKKESIDLMIQDLVDKDVISASGSVRKALDTLRLLGNAGVHPTGIDLEENPNTPFALFKVLNFVVEKLITEEKEMESIYALIPEGKRENLDNRRSK